jgi:hypothetical protein
MPIFRGSGSLEITVAALLLASAFSGCAKDRTVPLRSSAAGHSGGHGAGAGAAGKATHSAGKAGTGGDAGEGGATNGDTGGSGPSRSGSGGTTNHPGSGGNDTGGSAPTSGGSGGTHQGATGGAAGAGDESGAGDEGGAPNGGVPAETGGSAGAGAAAGTLGVGAGGANAGSGGQGGASCASAPVTLASSAQAWALAVRNGSVYYTTHRANGTIESVSVAGGSVSTLESGELYPHDIAVNDDHVFWATVGDEPGYLFQASLAGDNRRQIATPPDDDFAGIFNLSADATNVYYTTDFNDAMELPIVGPSDPLPATVELSGGPYDSMIVEMALFGGDLYWTNHGVGTFEPWSSETASIDRVNVAGVPAPYPLVNRLDYPQFAIAVDQDGVFWNDGTSIYRTARSGGAYADEVTLLPAAPDVSPVVGMVSDGAHLFFADRYALYRVPVAGGSAELMTDGWSRITRLAQDDANIYFTDPNLGAVVKIAKCASSAPSGGSLAESSGGSAGQGGTAGLGGAPGSGGSPAGSGGQGGVTTTGSGGAAGASGAVPFVPATNGYGLALDESYLYFSEYGTSGGIYRVLLAGGTPEAIAPNEKNAYDIAVDATNVYYSLNDTNAGHLAMVPKAGGARTPLATGINQYGTGRVASDGAFAYYVTGFNFVFRVSTTGNGTPSMVAAGPYNSTAVDLALANGRVFWINDGTFNDDYSAKLPGTGYIGEAAASGSADVGHDAVFPGLDSPVYRIATDSTNVYFIAGTTLYRRGLLGGGVTPIGTTPPASGIIQDLISDGTSLYFADNTGVYRIPVGGGATETLATGFSALRTLAADATFVYFTDQLGTSIMKLSK